MICFVDQSKEIPAYIHQYNLNINTMNGEIYRCGWCGNLVDKSGMSLMDESFGKAKRIIEKYGDYRTEKVNGECCRHEGNY